jgi:hypothetical protein
MSRALVVTVLLFIVQSFVASSAVRERDTNVCTVRVLVINYDPIVQNGTRLSRHMKWNDPRLITTNLVSDLRACSGGHAQYEIVDFIDVDAFPQKRDGFRYNEATFLEMWKDRKKAHQPDAVSYAAIFKEQNLLERIKKED